MVKRASSLRTLVVGAELFDDIMPLIEHLEPAAFLFPAVGTCRGTRITECWTANGVLGRLRRACGRLGLPTYTPHSFRHFCATHLLDQGWPAMQVAKWLGHRNDVMIHLLYAAHVVEDPRLQLGLAASRLVERRLVLPDSPTNGPTG